MSLESIALLISVVVSVVTTYMYWRELKLKQAKAPSEQGVNVSNAVKSLSEALGLTSNELVESLTEASKLRDELDREREATKKRIEETVTHRAEMEEKIRQLNLHIEGLNRQYLAETQRLGGENAQLKKQMEVMDGDLQSVISENAALKKTVSELEGKYGNSKEIIEELLQLLNEKGVVDLPPKLLALLGDSIKGWKWPRGKKP